ncbi:hypothetical protein ACFV90_36855 [Streptomyces sp. NPDC059904]|uniref:hypothetical protein n=1 Tax=Streptomyces sp. NPDC059904 TaxID=3346996 RepID=UPI0036625491
MNASATAPLARRRITADYLLDAPLPELLAEFDVLLVDSRITDAGFAGGAVRRQGGGLLFAMRPGQPAWERDAIARAMLGRELNVPMPPLPSPYQLAEV